MSRQRKPISIRSMNAQDVSAVTRIHIQSSQEAHRGVLPNDYLYSKLPASLMRRWLNWKQNTNGNEGELSLVAVANDAEVLGFVSIVFDPDEPLGAFIQDLHVAPDHLRCGIARRLLAVAAIQFPSEFRQRPVHLFAPQHDRRACTVSHRLGGMVAALEEQQRDDGPSYGLLRYVWPGHAAFLAAISPTGA